MACRPCTGHVLPGFMSIGVVVTQIMTTECTKKDWYMIPSMVGGDCRQGYGTESAIKRGATASYKVVLKMYTVLKVLCNQNSCGENGGTFKESPRDIRTGLKWQLSWICSGEKLSQIPSSIFRKKVLGGNSEVPKGFPWKMPIIITIARWNHTPRLGNNLSKG